MLEEFEVQLVAAWRGTGWIEIIAAALAVAYLLLAIRQSIHCWVAAFVSSCLYVWVLGGAHLYMESALNGLRDHGRLRLLAVARIRGTGRRRRSPLDP